MQGNLSQDTKKSQFLGVEVDLRCLLMCVSVQAQLQRSLDSAVTLQPRALIGRRSRKEAAAGTESGGHGGSPMSEQDSGILDVEDEEEEEVSMLAPQTHPSVEVASEPLIWLMVEIKLHHK